MLEKRRSKDAGDYSVYVDPILDRPEHQRLPSLRLCG